VFDAVPMLFALIILAWFHPGRVLRGPRSDFSQENQEIKAAKKAKKMAKRQGRDQTKRERLLAIVARREEKRGGRA